MRCIVTTQADEYGLPRREFEKQTSQADTLQLLSGHFSFATAVPGCLSLDPVRRTLFPDRNAIQLLGFSDCREIMLSEFLEVFEAPNESHSRLDIASRIANPAGCAPGLNAASWTDLKCRGRDVGIFATQVHWNDGLNRWILIVADLTDTRGDQRAQTDSGTDVSDALAAARAGTWEYFPATERIVWTPECWNLFGVKEKRGVLSLEEWGELVDEADLKVMREKIRRTIAHREQHWSTEFRLKRPNSEIRWIGLSGHFIYDSTGNPQKALGISLDITSRKECEMSMQAARETAEAATRSRGEFLARMSHEIRTPMTAILGHLDLLASRIDESDLVQSLDTIRRNARFLLDIVNDIVDLSRIDAGHLDLHDECVRLDLLMSELYGLMSIRAVEKGLSFQIRCRSAVPEWIDTDSVRLRQILVNLISNAIKFTDHGIVEVDVDYRASEASILFEVTDSGIGIAETDQSGLFTPFRQIRRSGRPSINGSGLGLSISRRLAEALGGEISFRSREGVGSTFLLRIPCEPRPSQKLIQPHIPVRRPEIHITDDRPLNTHVLVVDDRRDIRVLAQRLLEKSGATVVSVSDGQAALDLLLSSAGQSQLIDVVLMDMQMPIIDGYKATQILREAGFLKPIIALTANAMKEDRRRCLEAGCTDYVTKPIDSRRLIQLIRRYVNDVGPAD